MLAIVAGVVLLVGAVVVLTVLGLRSGGGSDSSLGGPSQPADPPAVSPSESVMPSEGDDPPGDSSELPRGAAIEQSVAVVPVRMPGDPDRGLYLVDTEDRSEPVQLEARPGANANPMLAADRSTIVYLNRGVLRVMASDGSGDRTLFERDPAGCGQVTHASWNPADASTMVVTCRVSEAKDTMLVLGLDGRLIRRLDAGKDQIGDLSVSPDGQTAVFWASDDPDADGGHLYTLPLVGTGDPKRLTDSGDGSNADPAWSPDGTQIAFRRLVADGSGDGNAEVFVMGVDGSDVRQVTDSDATDSKPSWSPDGKNLLIVSNRESPYGEPQREYGLWLVRISDGEVLTPIPLEARQITRPVWTTR